MLDPNTYILAIDPGNVQSAFCLCSPELKPLAFLKCENIVMDGVIKRDLFFLKINEAISEHVPVDAEIKFVIEDIENFGLPAGRTLFDTAKYIGRISLLIEKTYHQNPEYIYRHEEKMAICHSPKANDATIRQALVDRFAPGYPNHGKGTKKKPSILYGMSADCWSAFAQAVAYHDREMDLPF